MRIVRDELHRAPAPADIATEVAQLIAAVREGGDSTLARLTHRFDRALIDPGALRVAPEEVEAALGSAPGALRDGLETAITNVDTLVRAQLREPVHAELEQGQRIEVAEVPVRAAGIYAPGGRAAYPSTVVMCAVTARAAGVQRVVVCAPPAPDGGVDPAILAACALCRVDEVLRVGGAQAIAALAYGTESIEPVDVVAGPGNAYVQEAKRQVIGDVGIDGIAGPSELIVVASGGADPELIALDLLAQAEHGPDSLVAALSDDGELLDAIAMALERLVGDRPSIADCEISLCGTGSAAEGLALAEAWAPEHLELVGRDAEALAGEVRRAGCVFVGRDAATAFGDYVAGSNHVLPTGGAARFQSALSASTFRRRMARVSFGEGAARRLAPAGAAIARAEGFPVHAESMERRA